MDAVKQIVADIEAAAERQSTAIDSMMAAYRKTGEELAVLSEHKDDGEDTLKSRLAALASEMHSKTSAIEAAIKRGTELDAEGPQTGADVGEAASTTSDPEPAKSDDPAHDEPAADNGELPPPSDASQIGGATS